MFEESHTLVTVFQTIGPKKWSNNGGPFLLSKIIHLISVLGNSDVCSTSCCTFCWDMSAGDKEVFAL